VEAVFTSIIDALSRATRSAPGLQGFACGGVTAAGNPNRAKVVVPARGSASSPAKSSGS
jgi:hypothetical protein